MVETLCELYGELSQGKLANKDLKFYDFAEPKVMAADCDLEKTLRNKGFGYRAQNIVLAAEKLVSIVSKKKQGVE